MDSVNKVFSVVEIILTIFLGLEFKRALELSTLNKTFYTAASFQSKIVIEKRADKSCISCLDRLLTHRINKHGPIVEEFKIVFDDKGLDKDLGNLFKKLFKIGVRKIDVIYKGNGYSKVLHGVINNDTRLQSLSITNCRCPLEIRKLSCLRSLTLVSVPTSAALSRVVESCELRSLIFEGSSISKTNSIPTLTVGPHLLKLEYRFGDYPKIQISPQNTLTSFNLTSTTINDHQLFSTVSEMSNLRHLHVSHCSRLQQTVISSESVVTIMVNACDGILKLSLNTPRLESLTFHTVEFRRPLYIDTQFAHANQFCADLTLVQRGKGYDKDGYFRALETTLPQFNNPITLTLEFPTEQDYQVSSTNTHFF